MLGDMVPPGHHQKEVQTEIPSETGLNSHLGVRVDVTPALGGVCGEGLQRWAQHRGRPREFHHFPGELQVWLPSVMAIDHLWDLGPGG